MGKKTKRHCNIEQMFRGSRRMGSECDRPLKGGCGLVTRRSLGSGGDTPNGLYWTAPSGQQYTRDHTGQLQV